MKQRRKRVALLLALAAVLFAMTRGSNHAQIGSGTFGKTLTNGPTIQIPRPG